MFGHSQTKADYYSEGYGDGQQYASEYPELTAHQLAEAQISASAINVELGMSEMDNESWQGGFIDGYTGESYGTNEQSLYSSLLEESNE